MTKLLLIDSDKDAALLSDLVSRLKQIAVEHDIVILTPKAGGQKLGEMVMFTAGSGDRQHDLDQLLVKQLKTREPDQAPAFDMEFGRFEDFRFVVSDYQEPTPPKLAAKPPANKPYYQRGRW